MKEEYKYLVIYKTTGAFRTQSSTLLKTIEEVEDVLLRQDITIVYIGEYKPLKIKIDVK